MTSPPSCAAFSPGNAPGPFYEIRLAQARRARPYAVPSAPPPPRISKLDRHCIGKCPRVELVVKHNAQDLAHLHANIASLVEGKDGGFAHEILDSVGPAERAGAHWPPPAGTWRTAASPRRTA